jgi:Helicase conserved C-terminal domain./Class II histone deacetylase complex subunits 2 and 3.
MTPLQEEYYSKIISYYLSRHEETAIGVLQKLLEVCDHPFLINDEFCNKTSEELVTSSGKLKILLNILDLIENKDEKCVIFTKYKKMQSILKKVIMDYYNICPAVINGEIRSERYQIIESFRHSKGFNVIILSTRAAGVGITLTEANNVIHYTRDWNPAVESQATDRVYRIGQDREVNVFYPIVVSDKGCTVEERLDEVLRRKRKLCGDILIPSKEISVNEKDYEFILQDIFDFNKNVG